MVGSETGRQYSNAGWFRDRNSNIVGFETGRQYPNAGRFTDRKSI
jgi:hypothetical protein